MKIGGFESAVLIPFCIFFFFEHVYRLFEGDFGASSHVVSLYIFFCNMNYSACYIIIQFSYIRGVRCHVLAAGNETRLN
jgi:hypothetical protein